MFEKIEIPVINDSLELADCADKWEFDEANHCWCLEDVLYTDKATTPKFQRLSIYVPQAYMDPNGKILPQAVSGCFTTKTAPVIFENNSAGYMQMPHTWIGGPRDEAGKYLKRGMVYITCGSRGRESKDQNGKLCAKSPWTLVDLKTAIRFLRHNANAIPGNMDHMISVGWSAGGAMSTLIGVTGNNMNYIPYLKENGAFMDERDDVFASQIYCPIIDLEHADLAYEWMFQNDPENEDSPAGPAGVMTPFQEALSKRLASDYITYFNNLKLVHPVTGAPILLGEDGRSGSAYDYLMSLLEASATDYFTRLETGLLPETYSIDDYLNGNYTFKAAAPMPEKKPDIFPENHPQNLLQGHAGPGVALPCMSDLQPLGDESLAPPRPSLGDLVSRPPRGIPYKGIEFPMVDKQGINKHSWLSWDGKSAHIRNIDDYILNHRRRMKPCTSFDKLDMDSGENQVFGTSEKDYMHFNTYIANAIASLKKQFPEEYDNYYPAFASVIGDEELAKRCYLINPLNFINTDEVSNSCSHFRIHVGACDADTSFSISMTLALLLANAGKDVQYRLIWDRPHCQADYPFEVCDWIEEICN